MAGFTAHAQSNQHNNSIAVEQQPPSLEDRYHQELDKWMLQAYEGDQDAQFKVGVLFTNSQFNNADFEQAVYWYKQAARQGHTLAQYNLGHQYITGVGVKRSETEAMKWWLKAAEHDHPLAQFNVGRAYYLGIGLEEDHDQARFWFQRAAQNKEPKSIEILAQLGWSNSAESIANASPANSAPVSNETPSAAPKAKPIESKLANQNKKKPTALEATAASAGDEQALSLNEMPIAPITEPTKNSQLKAKKQTRDAGMLNPIAIYTNPAKRSVLIAIINKRDELRIVSESSEWAIVTSTTGFPIWVHQNYVSKKGNKGEIKGNAVNARSVPLIANGTIVGKLNNKEVLSILNKKNDWYRLMSPPRFRAWIKSDEFSRGTIAASGPKLTGDASNRSFTTEDDWLFSQPETAYTLQLASFSDPEKISAFEARKKFVGNPDLHRFTSFAKDTKWTFFLYGSYNSSDEAKEAREKIGQKLAWTRSFGRLQQNRCLAWKKQIPAPKSLNRYCSS